MVTGPLALSPSTRRGLPGAGWVVASLVSGGLWASLAHTLGVTQHIDASFAAWAGPLVGLAQGIGIRPMRDTDDWVGAALVSLVGLYVAATVFGALVGVATPYAGFGAPPSMAARALDGALTLVWGLSFTGLAMLLWPLSLLNHLAVWRLQRRAEG